MTEAKFKEQLQAWQDKAAALRDMLMQAQDGNSSLVAEIRALERKLAEHEAKAAKDADASPELDLGPQKANGIHQPAAMN